MKTTVSPERKLLLALMLLGMEREVVGTNDKQCSIPRKNVGLWANIWSKSDRPLNCCKA